MSFEECMKSTWFGSKCVHVLTTTSTNLMSQNLNGYELSLGAFAYLWGTTLSRKYSRDKETFFFVTCEAFVPNTFSHPCGISLLSVRKSIAATVSTTSTAST